MPKNVSFDSQPKTKDKEKSLGRRLYKALQSIVVSGVLVTVFFVPFFIGVWLVFMILDSMYELPFYLFDDFYHLDLFLLGLALVPAIFCARITYKYLKRRAKSKLQISENPTPAVDFYKSDRLFRFITNFAFFGFTGLTTLFFWTLVFLVLVNTWMFVMEDSFLHDADLGGLIFLSMPLAIFTTIKIKNWWKVKLGFSPRLVYLSLFLTLLTSYVYFWLFAYYTTYDYSLEERLCPNESEFSLETFLISAFLIYLLASVLAVIGFIFHRYPKVWRFVNYGLVLASVLFLIALAQGVGLRMGWIDPPYCYQGFYEPELRDMPRDPNDFADF